MARIRTVKPEFWTSLTVAQMTRDARLTFLGLLNYVDDDGRAVDDCRLIRAAIFPLDDLALEQVDGWLDEMTGVGMVVRYEVSGRRYLQITGFTEHQRVDKHRASKLPPPEEGSTVPRTLPEPSSNPPGAVVEDSRGEWNGMEQGTGKGREGKVAPPDASTTRPGVVVDHPTIIVDVSDLTPQQRMFGEICEALNYSADGLSREDAKEVGKVAGQLLARGMNPDEMPRYTAWLTGESSPIVNGTRLTLHSLPKWVKDYDAAPRLVTKSLPRRSSDTTARILAAADRAEELS